MDVSRFQPRVLITAGPTHEPIDAVRYLANRSSGRMGIALAEASIQRGWPTTLLLGPTPLQPPHSSHLRTLRFQTTADLQALLHEHWPRHDLLIMAAAVADYRPALPAHPSKLNREERTLTLQLEPTPDLVGELASITQPHQTAVGFALEPADLPAGIMDAAREKLKRKRLDAIIVNPLETMDAEHVSAEVLFADGQRLAAPPGVFKAEFAGWLLNALEPLIRGRAAARA